jgi:hypothetical protein
VTHSRDQKTTEERSGPPVAQPGSRPNAEVLTKTNVTHMVIDAGVVVVDADVLRRAADLIADYPGLERRAYERGVLRGFADGWDQRGNYEAERGAA